MKHHSDEGVWESVWRFNIYSDTEYVEKICCVALKGCKLSSYALKFIGVDTLSTVEFLEGIKVKKENISPSPCFDWFCTSVGLYMSKTCVIFKSRQLTINVNECRWSNMSLFCALQYRFAIQLRTWQRRPLMIFRWRPL